MKSKLKNTNIVEEQTNKQQPSILSDLLFLFLKVAMIGMFLVLFFTFMFGITQVHDETMDPAVKEGDLAIYYRLQKNYAKDDVIAFKILTKRTVIINYFFCFIFFNFEFYIFVCHK